MPMLTRTLVTLATSAVMLGCPGEEDSPANPLGAAGSQAVEDALARARAMEDRPAPPGLDKLCALQFEKTSFDDAVHIFGEADDQSMDKSKAGLSYRYRDGVSLVLTFDWHDGTPGWGTYVTGIGSTSAWDMGYLLSEASIQGVPYPPCWPHEEP